MERKVVAVDLGGSKMRVAVADEQGKIYEQITISTDVKGGADSVISSLLSSIRVMQSHFGNQAIKAVGVAVAGQVEAPAGVVRFAPNLYWHDVALGSRLQQILNLPVEVVNDVRAATWGEMCFGAGSGCKELICVFFGTGIGGGMVLNGELVAGYNNSAGEVGHLILSSEGAVCTCGNRGCWETLAGGWAIEKLLKAAAAEQPLRAKALLNYAGGEIDQLIPSHLFLAALDKDPLALSLAGKVIQAMADGVKSLAHIFNPQLIILGGGLVERAPWLVEKIEAEVKLRALKTAAEKLQVRKAECGESAPLLGVANLAIKKAALEG